MGFSRQEYWSGLPCPPPGDLPDPGMKPVCLLSSVLAGRIFTIVPTGKPYTTMTKIAMRFSSVQLLSCVQLFATLLTVVCQFPLSMGFSRQKYWGGVLCPPPGDFPDPGTEPTPLLFHAVGRRDSLPLALPGKPSHNTQTQCKAEMQGFLFHS